MHCLNSTWERNTGCQYLVSSGLHPPCKPFSFANFILYTFATINYNCECKKDMKKKKTQHEKLRMLVATIDKTEHCIETQTFLIEFMTLIYTQSRYITSIHRQDRNQITLWVYIKGSSISNPISQCIILIMLVSVFLCSDGL